MGIDKSLPFILICKESKCIKGLSSVSKYVSLAEMRGFDRFIFSTNVWSAVKVE